MRSTVVISLLAKNVVLDFEEPSLPFKTVHCHLESLLWTENFVHKMEAPTGSTDTLFRI